MALPTSIYIHTNDRAKPIALTGVTDWRFCKWRKPSGTYRDGGPDAGTANVYTATTARTNDATFPVIPDGDNTVASVNFKPAVSDELAHVPPRQKWEIISGLVVALNNAVIPTPPVLPDLATGRQVYRGLDSVTVTAASDRIDASEVLWRVGDKVTFSATTLPGGITSGVVYEILTANGGNQITLKDPTTGGILDITSAGTSVVMRMVTPAARVLPYSIGLTAANATEEFTMTGSYATNYFITGDIIRLSGTMPTGVTANTEYRVRLTTSHAVFQLEDPDTGDLITFSTNGSGLVGYLVRPAEQDDSYSVVQLDGISGLLRFPDSLSPKISTVQ